MTGPAAAGSGSAAANPDPETPESGPQGASSDLRYCSQTEQPTSDWRTMNATEGRTTTRTADLDPAGVMAEHRGTMIHGAMACRACSYAPHPCLPYRLAAELAAAQKVIRATASLDGNGTADTAQAIR